MAKKENKTEIVEDATQLLDRAITRKAMEYKRACDTLNGVEISPDKINLEGVPENVRSS